MIYNSCPVLEISSHGRSRKEIWETIEFHYFVFHVVHEGIEAEKRENFNCH